MTDRETLREWQKIRNLEQETGILGMDSTAQIHRAAIEKITGKSASDLPASAARAVYDALRNKPRARAAMATDAKTIAARTERFPHADRLHKGFYYRSGPH
jgi:hypothetical protein